MRDYFGADYGKFKDKVDFALNGTAVEFEWSSVPLVDGLVHHFMVSFTPERSADGKVKGFITCLFNIDPLKKSEAALRLTQEHLGLALEAGQMGTWEVDLKTQDLTGSAHLLEIHGINELPQDLTTAINLTVHPEDRDALRETLAASVKDHTSFEHHYRIVRPSDWAIRWLEGRGQAKYNDDGEANCLLGIVSDITEKKLLQLEAERARQELHNYFMQAPVPLVILTGPDHHFTLANAPYERLVGRKVVGKTVREAFSDKIAKDFIPLLDQVYRTGVPYVGNELPIQFPDENGKDIDYWINVGYQPARDKQGNTIGLFVIVHDVTEQVLARKNLENSEARLLQSESMLKTLKQIAENERAKLASIFAQSPGAIAVFEGPNHVFTMANPAYVTQFFGGRQDLIGQSVSKAVPEAVEQGFEKLLNTVYQTGVPYIGIETPIDLLQPDGKMRKFHLNLVYQPLRDTAEKITGIVAVITDVTEQVATRIRLQESEARLQAAKSEAEKANQTKSSFLANMSHEIRTPLSAILGFTDLLKDSELSFRERNQFLETISRNGKALTTIIDDILDLAKVESGKLDIENLNFSLFDLIDDVMDVFRERTHSKNIFLRAHLNKNTPARVFSDPTRIRQILINLVGNAVKFTTNGGVTIEVSASENSDEKTQFTILVKDTGVGLTSEQKERLFQPFMQADNSTTRKFGGTGLGLALSKRLAGALGGDIFIEANENAQNGCTFGFTFAASVPKQSVTDVKIKDNTQKNIEQNDQLLSGVSVLLAEDSTDNQLLVRLVLTKQGATVETANNGVEAFKMGMNGNFDIALMDIQMPEMDGYEATRALREAGFKKPIVALTAHAMPEERARTLAAGCSAHLTKPLNQAELIETIERLTSYTKNNVDPRRDH